MRKLLVLVTLAAVAVRGEEPSVSMVRQLLHAKLLESLPPFQPAKPPNPIEIPAIFARLPENLEPSNNKPPVDSTVVMSPFVVSEYWRDRALRSDLARQTQPETFSPVSGGTLYSKDIGRVRMNVGGWWSPGQGWSFLKFSW